ncbi:dynamin family protein [Brevibacillus ginsengisoli]|uniref:dynamin family protein n=1 Tax=Brevibacillus ginsengisoli TaxID=363854 RepID=UPI003CF3C5E1
MASNYTVEAPIGMNDLASRLIRLQNELEQAKDKQNADKLTQLVRKVETGEMSIAFCGHFSAGKSTMINTLLGRELLPSNPIPTSANVVKIRSGEPAARAYTRHHGVVSFDPTTEIDQLKKYAVDGDTVDWVEIQYPDLFMGDQGSLLDTPGIDSTDAAHKIATESALHLADVVIYMMDYNHVQAEENFNFTKTLKDRGKPVYLVINMIDKHVDFELDFDSYKESVEESFATWNIQPDGIFYTSLAEPDHPENQYEEFRAKLKELFTQSEQYIQESVTYSAQYLIEEHVRFVSRQNEEARQALEAKLEALGTELGAEEAQTTQAKLNALTTEIEQLNEQLTNARSSMEKELQTLLENARLTYYSTNEAAEKYLESRKPNFKVGLLFSGKKTEEERTARMQNLLSDFSEKVASNLEWHYKDLLSKLPEQFGVRDEAYHAAVHAIKIEVTPEFLASQVKEGAVSSEYVLNYCKDISNGIKVEYRRTGLHFIEQVTKRLSEQLGDQLESLRAQADKLRNAASVYAQLEELKSQEHTLMNQLRAILLSGQ